MLASEVCYSVYMGETTQEARMGVRFEIVITEDGYDRDEEGYQYVRVIEVDAQGFTVYTGAADPVVLDVHCVPDARRFIAQELECIALAAEAAEFGMGIYEYACQPFGLEWEREQKERRVA